MSAKHGLILGGVAALIAGFAATASADDNGIAASIHDLRREGGRLCFTDHYHYGTGSGATKAAAMRSAIVSWQDFTAFEYGSDWARWGKASSKQASCSKSASGVDCSLNARPCK